MIMTKDYKCWREKYKKFSYLIMSNYSILRIILSKIKITRRKGILLLNLILTIKMHL